MLSTCPRRPLTVVVAALLALVVTPVAAAAQLGDVPFPPTPPPGDPGPYDVLLEAFEPLPAADEVEVSEEARQLRAELLGDDALDPDTVTLHWVGVSSFVATVAGHLVLFDAWEIVGIHRDVLPIGREELAGLEPEAILVGHGHFDHAADVGYVAGSTGATVVASQEVCDRTREDARFDGVADDFPCAVTGTADSPAPGATQELALFADLDPVVVLQHVHSTVRPPGGGNELAPFLPVFDPRPYLNLNLDPAELARFLRSLDAPQGGTWMYHVTVGDFTLLWGNSSGPLFEHPEVAEALATLPGCVDVMTNALLGFGQVVSGLQDPRLYLDAVRPRVFIPTHADAWLPVISAGQAQYVRPFQHQVARLDHPPEVDFLLDPQDYLVPRVYDVTDPVWSQPPEGSRCADDAEASTDEGSRTEAERRAEAAPSPDPAAGDGTSTGDGDGLAPERTAASRPLPVTGSPWLAAGTLLLAAGAALRRHRTG